MIGMRFAPKISVYDDAALSIRFSDQNTGRLKVRFSRTMFARNSH